MTAADDDARWDDSWDYSPTRFEMEQTRLQTVEKLQQSGRVRPVKEKKDDEAWTSDDINNMSMEEYAKQREHLIAGVNTLSPDEFRSAESIPEAAQALQVHGLLMRQSGRTTRMLMEAQAAKVAGHTVRIVAPNTHILHQLIMRARNLGLLSTTTPGGQLDRQKEFITAEEVLQGRTRGLRDAKFFFDHTVQEQLSTEKMLALSIEVHQQQMSEKAPEPRWSFASF